MIAFVLSAAPARGDRPTPKSTTAPLFEIFRGLCDDLGASVSDDEIMSEVSRTPCDATCMDNMENLRRAMVAARGRPGELILRQVVLQNVYFAERQDPSTLGAAMLRSDPPLVIDAPNKSVLMRSDVVGMINLSRFGNSKGAPKHYQPSEREVRELVTALEGELASAAASRSTAGSRPSCGSACSRNGSRSLPRNGASCAATP